MGSMVYSLLWVVQDLYHEPYHVYEALNPKPLLKHWAGAGFLVFGAGSELESV